MAAKGDSYRRFFREVMVPAKVRGMNQRVKKVQQAITKQKLDALLVRVFEGDNQNVLYLSGFAGSSAHLVITPKKAFIITDARYFGRVVNEAPDFKLVKMARGKKATDHINEVLTTVGLGKDSRIGIEADHISMEVGRRWEKEIKGKLVSTLHLVERFRQYKDEAEIEALRKACRSTSKVYNEVVPLIRAGMTELELAFEIDMRLRKHGAISNSFTSIVASGPNSAVPHHATCDRKLKAGEPVIMDFGGLYPGGYCSDITRTAFVPGKKPHARMIEIYNVVLRANKAAFKALRPGIMWKEFDKVARDYIVEHGYGQYFTHGLGHSLGLVAHDPYDYEKDAFQEGMIVTNEPGIYIDDFGGVRIEDDVVVTATGAQNLTSSAPYWKF